MSCVFAADFAVRVLEQIVLWAIDLGVLSYAAHRSTRR